MMKMIAGAIVGVAIIFLGIYVWYIYMVTYLEQGNHILFALSMVQIGIGIFILFKASNSGAKSLSAVNLDPIQPNEKGFEEKLRENNEIMRDWHKTADFRDKLKVLKVAAAEQLDADTHS